MINTYFIIAKPLDMKIIPDAKQYIKNKRRNQEIVKMAAICNGGTWSIVSACSNILAKPG